MSKYKQVYNDLKEKIDTRFYKRNTELPSENELVKEYGYSKDTIRKALSLLEINGYIQKIKGKNSLILGHGRIKNNYLGNIKTSSELNIDGKYEIKTTLESLYIIQGEKKIMDIFSADENNDFYRKDVLFYSEDIDFSSIKERINNMPLNEENVYFGKRAIFWGKFNEKNYLKTAYHKYLIKESFYKAVTIRNGRTFMKIAELLDKEH